MADSLLGRQIYQLEAKPFRDKLTAQNSSKLANKEIAEQQQAKTSQKLCKFFFPS